MRLAARVSHDLVDDQKTYRHARVMMRFVRVSFGTMLAATVLALCLGLQVLEATGRWDRTIRDTGDEAVIVSVALCIGAAITMARAAYRPVRLSAIRFHIEPAQSETLIPFFHPALCPAFSASPPLSLLV